MIERKTPHAECGELCPHLDDALFPVPAAMLPPELVAVKGLLLVHAGSRCPGVYFMIQCMRVTRVGQSGCVARRVVLQRDRDYDYAVFLPIVEPDELDRVESMWLYKLEPRWNGRYADGRIAAPLRPEALGL